MEKNEEIVAIEAIESMIPGFGKLMKYMVKGKTVVYLEGFFEGMITMKKIELGIFKEKEE